MSVSTIIGAALIALGVVLIAGSRVVADGFGVEGDSAATKFAGLGNDYKSRLYRWAVAVLAGLAFIGAGVARLFS